MAPGSVLSSSFSYSSPNSMSCVFFSLVLFDLILGSDGMAQAIWPIGGIPSDSGKVAENFFCTFVSFGC